MTCPSVCFKRLIKESFILQVVIRSIWHRAKQFQFLQQPFQRLHIFCAEHVLTKSSEERIFGFQRFLKKNFCGFRDRCLDCFQAFGSIPKNTSPVGVDVNFLNEAVAGHRIEPDPKFGLGEIRVLKTVNSTLSFKEFESTQF